MLPIDLERLSTPIKLGEQDHQALQGGLVSGIGDA
jgi:hypothetical protein